MQGCLVIYVYYRRMKRMLTLLYIVGYCLQIQVSERRISEEFK